MPAHAFPLLLGYSLLEGAVEVDADSIASDPRVLVCEGEHEGSVIAEAHALLPHTQASFWLAEEHDVGRERKVCVVFQRVTPQQLRSLSNTVAAWVPTKKKTKKPHTQMTNNKYFWELPTNVSGACGLSFIFVPSLPCCP